AGQAAVVAALEGAVEHVVFGAIQGREAVQPGLVDVGVTGGAGAGSAAVGGDAGHRGEGGGLHDGLANVSGYLVCGAIVLDESQCWHGLLLGCSGQGWAAIGVGSKRGTRPRVSKSRGPIRLQAMA